MTSTSSSPSTALVTGATSGIGRATAIALAATGIHVAVSGRDKVRGDLTVAAIRPADGRADFVPAHLRDAASATQLAGTAEAGLGHAEDIAGAIVYLASPEAAFTHGVVLPVDGGRVAV